MIQKSSAWRVFGSFAKSPAKAFHVRELSRILDLAPTSINIHIKDLEKNKLILQDKTGIYTSYKANFDSDKFRFYKKIHNLIELKESGLIEEIEDKLFPTAIVLFGSYLKGEDIESSDIDLLLIAEKKSINLASYEKQLSRKIQLFFSDDINKLPRELKNNILNGIVLSVS